MFWMADPKICHSDSPGVTHRTHRGKGKPKGGSRSRPKKKEAVEFGAERRNEKLLIPFYFLTSFLHGNCVKTWLGASNRIVVTCTFQRKAGHFPLRSNSKARRFGQPVTGRFLRSFC